MNHDFQLKLSLILDLYNSSTGGPAASSGGNANWSSWGLTNSGSAGSSEYSRFNYRQRQRCWREENIFHCS